MIIHFSASAQSMNEIRWKLFYNIPFDSSSSFKEVTDFIDSEPDSFRLTKDTTYVHDGHYVAYIRIYQSVFIDPHFGTYVDLIVSAYGTTENSTTHVGLIQIIYANPNYWVSHHSSKKTFQLVSREVRMGHEKTDKLWRKEFDGRDWYKTYTENGISFYDVRYPYGNELKLTRNYY
ncbi:MAG TPA: hypothetical protein VL651_11055 [Bacteroidia bacterium]|nr:hypothetical protein [Bacteroidia bacterium]